MEDTTSLFNYRDPRSMRADTYASQYQPLSGTPQNMIVQTAANAGSLIGNALFGGRTSAMAEQSVLNEAIKESEVAEDPDERLSLFANALRKRGLEGYAQKAEMQLLNRQKTLSDINKNKADSEMKQVAYANRFAALTSQFPEMKPEVARGLALDETAFREFFKDKQIKYSSDVEEIAAELFGKPFSNLTTAQAKQVNALKEERGVKKASATAPKIINNLPSTSSDIVGFRKDLNTVVKPFRDAVNAADQAITLADDAIKSNNFASAASLARSLAKASGEEQLSSRDVAAFGGDPSLIGGVADTISRLTSGTPTKDTLLKLKSLATILKNKNDALEKQELTKMQNLARISGKYSDAEINEVFENRITPPKGGGKGKTSTTKSGVKYTVED